MTVLGPIQPGEMGVTLPHEHVLVDFIGWKKTGKHRWNSDEVCPVVLPHLEQLKQLGCKTLVECSPNFIGRDPALLKRLSKESGLNILTNTGLYAAANEQFVPDYARSETADQLAKRWTQESEEGIDGTGVKPGFIKIGVKNGPLNEIDQKLVRAACLTHKETGLAIACHSGGNGAIADEMRILKEEGVRGDALVWVHAQNEQDMDLLMQAVDFGVWVSYDKVNHNSMEKDIARILQYKQQGALSNLHLSHDAGWYSPGQENGGDFRPFDAIFTALLPALKDIGFTDDEIKQITQTNPQQAFTITKRLL
ncbi:MAG: hypothetical protein P9L94_00815 [Candidatus Hinthialibacter antarcticus]|nr:hypothetical protein [Candidatus Hinthialibacter antarcticus]